MPTPPQPWSDQDTPVAIGPTPTAANAPLSPAGDATPAHLDHAPPGEAASHAPPPQPGWAGPRSQWPTAAAFTEETMLRPTPQAPAAGWRRVVHRLTGGMVNPGPSPAELAERALAARVKTPITGSRRIAVISRKGGVGKTTTAAMVGHTFASWRGDRVVAVDGNPDAGSLGYRIRLETAATLTSLLADADDIARYADVRAYTSQAPTGLEVIASDDDPGITRALGEDDYATAIQILDRYYNLLLLDTGTGILDSGIQGILREADQLIVVVAPALDGARVAAATLDWLDRHGYAHLTATAVAAINGVRPDAGLVEVARVAEHFAARCAATVRIPFDAHLQAGAQTTLDDLAPATRRAYLDVAAAVADHFALRSHRGPTLH